MMHADVILVGGGLAGGLLALRLSTLHPDKRVLLLEKGPTLGGNHTWSFFTSDVKSMEWLEPLISKSWPSYEVTFPKLARTIESPYCSIRSDHYHKVLTEKLRSGVRLNCEVRAVHASSVELASGETLFAPLIVDATGMPSTPKQPDSTLRGSSFAGAACGWLKFMGFDLKLKKPHSLQRPVLMDAKVPQMEGFRYFYCLPWDETRVMVEETFYSANPEINRERLKLSLLSYAERMGWDVEKVEREEFGVLPLPLLVPEFDRENPTAFYSTGEDFESDEPVKISSGQGWFHSTTGHSFADAVRVAEFIAELSELRTGSVRPRLREFRRQWAERQQFYRLLNRLMFRAAEPSLRYQVFEKFYSSPNDVISRFQAGLSSPRDRTRILSNRPPIPVARAMKYWKEKTSDKSAATT